MSPQITVGRKSRTRGSSWSHDCLWEMGEVESQPRIESRYQGQSLSAAPHLLHVPISLYVPALEGLPGCSSHYFRDP